MYNDKEGETTVWDLGRQKLKKIAKYRNLTAAAGMIGILAMPATVSAGPDELMNATLWTQTAVEFKATSVTAYKLAEVMLDRALDDKRWTA